MMMKCPRHGYQFGILMSPDLALLADEGNKAESFRIVSFIYRDEVESMMYLSEKFAEDHGLSSESRLPLPDDYPEWYLKLEGTCEKCAAESMQGARLVQS